LSDFHVLIVSRLIITRIKSFSFHDGNVRI